MAYTWGEGGTLVELKILWGKYSPPHAEAIFAKSNLIPSPTVQNPVEVHQQGGREKYSITFEAYVDNLADYDTLQDDWHAGTVKEFNGPESFKEDMFIEYLSPAEYVLPSHIRFTIKLCLEES